MARNAVLLKIKSLMPSLSAKEKRVADFILNDPKTVSRMTIVEISAIAGIAISATTCWRRSSTRRSRSTKT